ncbi:hypothetical protein F5Y07DRAFT_374601 [Xylaria sp. FL0933]|nr:hypothetical protein F5Y07DRAFT_374601 [Xylaria sp. FL0933]
MGRGIVLKQLTCDLCMLALVTSSHRVCKESITIDLRSRRGMYLARVGKSEPVSTGIYSFSQGTQEVPKGGSNFKILLHVSCILLLLLRSLFDDLVSLVQSSHQLLEQ